MRKRYFSLMVLGLSLVVAFAAMGGSGLAAQADVRSVIVNPNQPFQASLWTDRSNYNPGDRLTAHFQVSKNAYVYLFDIDTTGSVSLIYPNIYSENNYKRANTTYSLPDNSRYNLTIGGPAGTEQLVLIATPKAIKDVEWIRRSLEQGTFGPQLNVSISAEKFMFELRSVTVTPTFGSDWASAYTTFTVGGFSPWPSTPTYPPVTPPQPNRYGTINVTSQPSGATVFVDGVDRGTTPLTVTGVEFGTHDITVVKQGYYTYASQITVSNTGTYPLHAVLSRVPGGSQPVQEVALVSRQFTVKWPSTGPFVENFSYHGYSGSVTVDGSPLLGMLTEVRATMRSDGVGPVEFARIAPSGPDAPWPGRTYEKIQYPFRVRLTVMEFSTTTGAIFGLQYLDSVKVRVDVWYVGN
jgi:hypothetical protein